MSEDDKTGCQFPERKLTTIDEATRKFRTKGELSQDIVELRMLISSQEMQLKKANEQLKNKDEQIKHLESMLSSAGSLQVQSEVIASDEESIAAIQLMKLRNKALLDELTLEEARKLEIYAKIKRTSEPKEKDITPPYRDWSRKADPKELAAVAAQEPNREDDSVE